MLSWRICVIAALGVALVLNPDVSSADDAAEALLSKMLDRANQIGSGIFQFRVASQIVVEGKASEADVDANRTELFDLTIDGSEWIQRFADSNNKAMSRRGFSAVYYETVNDAGKEYKSLTLSATEGGLDRNPEQTLWKDCAYIGTIAVPAVRTFLSENSARATVHECTHDSIACKVVELTVAKKDLFKALHAVPPALLQQGDATIRLMISAALGHGLLRYEVVGADGTAYDVTESSGFYDAGGGVFLPKKWQRTRGRAGRALVDTIEVISSSNVNEEIPAAAFDFSVPAGTRVSDSRPEGTGRVFVLKAGIDLGTVDDSIKKELDYKPIGEGTKRGSALFAVAVANGVGLLCLIGLVVVRRMRQERSP